MIPEYSAVFTPIDACRNACAFPCPYVRYARVGVGAHTRRWGLCSDPSLSISFLSAGHSWLAVAAAAETQAGKRRNDQTEEERGGLMGGSSRRISLRKAQLVARETRLVRRPAHDNTRSIYVFSARSQEDYLLVPEERKSARCDATPS